MTPGGPRRKALVLGDDTRSFLSVIRSLGRGGVEVHVGWHQADGAALCSRYVSKAHDLPPYDEHDEAWKTALIGLMEQEQFDLIIPCSDPTFIPIQQHKRVLEPHGRLYVLNEKAFDVLFDKFKTNALARSVGVRVPREIVLDGHSEFKQALSDLRFPLVLKPQTSFDPDNPGRKRNVKKAFFLDEYIILFNNMSVSGPVSVQENFVGDGVGVELLLQDGEPLMAFQHVRLHEPLHGGGSSYRKGVAVTPELLEAALKILRPLNYTGVAMVEFKVDPKTSDWVFIEVNARFWGSLPLAIASGADFPLALFQLLVDGQTSFPRAYREGLCCRNLLLDFRWHLANLRADRSDPTLATRPIHWVLFEACKNLALVRERSDTFTVDDPGPGWAELRQLGCDIWGSLRRRVMQRYLMSGPVRRCLENRAREGLRAANTILFVCKGNICRSPFAEHLALRSFSPDRTILSAGCCPDQGRQSPENAISAAARWGVDLSGHRSRGLTESLVQDADVIFVFDHENYERVIADYGFARGRVHLVGALCAAGPLFIDDPWGREGRAFEQSYQQIADAIRGPA